MHKLYLVEKETGMVVEGKLVGDDYLCRSITKGFETYIKRVSPTELYDKYEDFLGDINEQPIPVTFLRNYL